MLTQVLQDSEIDADLVLEEVGLDRVQLVVLRGLAVLCLQHGNNQVEAELLADEDDDDVQDHRGWVELFHHHVQRERPIVQSDRPNYLSIGIIDIVTINLLI